MSSFYHISPKLYAVGGQIRGNGKDKVDPRIEEELQARKPDGFLSRRDAMYCRPTTDFSRCGIVNAGYIYRVKPEEPLQRHDLNWIGDMQKALLKLKHPNERLIRNYPAWTDELVERCCVPYWKQEASDSPVWEFLTPSITIEEVLSDSIVDASNTKGGWLPKSR